MLRVRVRCVARTILGDPLVLAQEAHHGVEAEVAQTHTADPGAIHLHWFWVEAVRLELATPHEQTLCVLNTGGHAAEVLPKAPANHLVALRPEAAHGHRPLRDTTVEILLGPPHPTLLASPVCLARLVVRVMEQGNLPLATHRANRARLCRRHGSKSSALVDQSQLYVTPIRRLDAPWCRAQAQPKVGRYWLSAAGVAASQAEAAICLAARQLPLGPLVPTTFANRMAARFVRHKESLLHASRARPAEIGF
mmetsp:Transcript_62251/g.161492  ORF Transcript_62251/g.161492 Transcript_62251/m.161492 type:complete len:251 (-) Transcript_62251:178-930(-)